MRSLNEVLSVEKWTGRCEVENRDMILYLEVLKEYAHEISEENVQENILFMSVDSIDINREDDVIED